jgi:hypothetical protein
MIRSPQFDFVISSEAIFGVWELCSRFPPLQNPSRPSAAALLPPAPKFRLRTTPYNTPSARTATFTAQEN